MDVICRECGAQMAVPPGTRVVICRKCHSTINVVAEAQTLDGTLTRKDAEPDTGDTISPETPDSGRRTSDAPTITRPRTRFNCPHCHKELTVPIGEEPDVCPQCGASLLGTRTLPTADATPAEKAERTAPTAGAAVPEAGRKTRRREPKRGRGLEWMREHFQDRYEILEFVKSGGMGAIYKARQLRPSRIVALKVMLGGHFASSKQVKRFEREAQAASMLQHPAIVPVYDFGEVDGQPYFSMEFVDGADLRAHVLQKNLSREEICRLMVRVCDAVHYAHQHGVIHRDLKPGNILVDELNRPRVLDFGLSRAPADDPAAASLLTSTGEFLGTPRYMSPEQALGKPSAVDERTDVFALGVTLYELILGVAPYPVEHARGLKVLEILSTAEPLKPSSFTSHVPIDLELIMLKAVAREKVQRYATAEEFAQDLENFLAGRPVSARPATFSYRVNRWLWRNRKVLTPVFASLLVLGVVVAFFGVKLWQQAEEQRKREQRIHELSEDQRRYVSGRESGRAAVQDAINDRQWVVASALAAQAPTFWPGESGIEGLSRKVERAAERFADTEIAELDSLIAQQDYEQARGKASGLLELAETVPHQGVKERLAGAGGALEDRCWAALQTSVELAYRREGALGAIDAFLGAFPASTHAGAAEALRSELAAWTPEQALESHEKAFAAAMAAMDWVEARQIADSARELSDGAEGEFVDRWQAMSGDLENQLAGVITARTAGRLEGVRSLNTEIRFVKGLALSRDGRLLVAGGDGGPITLWSTSEWRTVGTRDTGAAVRAIDINGDGDLVCAGLADGRALLLRAPGCELVQEFSAHDGAVRSVHFSSDGRYLASAGADKLALWDVTADERVDIGALGGSWPVCYSPDGTVLASYVAGDVPSVQLWEMPDGVEIQTFGVGSRPVVQGFSPDGGLLATGHTEPGRRRLMVWDIDQGKRVMAVTVREGTEPLLTKHNWALAFSPDGALIVTGDVDRQMKVWDAATGQLVANYECTGNPRAIVFTPDCRGIVAGLNDGTVWVWEVGRPRSDAAS